MLKDVVTNQAYLEKRKEDLLQIKKVSAQIREITEVMGEEVKQQGLQIGKN
jgi:hypothetical protein